MIELDTLCTSFKILLRNINHLPPTLITNLDAMIKLCGPGTDCSELSNPLNELKVLFEDFASKKPEITERFGILGNAAKKKKHCRDKDGFSRLATICDSLKEALSEPEEKSAPRPARRTSTHPAFFALPTPAPAAAPTTDMGDEKPVVKTEASPEEKERKKFLQKEIGKLKHHLRDLRQPVSEKHAASLEAAYRQLSKQLEEAKEKHESMPFLVEIR